MSNSSGKYDSNSDNTQIVSSSSETDSNEEERFELKKKFGLAGGVALLAGTMVGSGIFVSPIGVLAGTNGSVGLSLLLWAGCGLITMLASLCYCELASMFHESGSDYAYLKRGYGRAGPVLAFTFSWTTIFVSRASSRAGAAITFGSYIAAPFFGGTCTAPDVIVKCAAFAAVISLSLLNIFSVKASSKFLSALAIAKFVGMGIIIVGGIVRLIQGDKIGLYNFNNAFQEEDLATLSFTQVGLAFYQGLWSYDGWNTICYITEEVKNSKRTVPLAIIIAVPLVTLFYVLVNVAYLAGETLAFTIISYATFDFGGSALLWFGGQVLSLTTTIFTLKFPVVISTVLTPEEMLTSDAVAVTWGFRVLGSVGWIMSVAVCLSVLGSMNGGVLAGGRLPFVASRNEHLPQILGMATVDYHTPGPSIIMSLLLSIIYIIPNDFNQLVNAFGFTSWLFYGLVIASVIILRFTHKDYPRPYKVPIPIPILALVIATYLVVAPLVDDPDIFILYAAGFMLCGPIMYFIFVYKKLKIPGMDHVTMFFQKLFNVAPTDYKNN